MTRFLALALYVCVATAGASVAAAQTPPAPPRIVRLGSCTLESGDRIDDCRLAVRVFGQLSPARDNAVVFTTWFLGRTEGALGFYAGNGTTTGLIDTTKYQVIAIGAFGNGESSSPSNTAGAQAGAGFPRVTMRDMVNAQRRLLADSMGLARVHAIVGASMGGMQAIQWSVAYPEFMDRIAALVPTPRTSAYDRVLWGTELRAVETAVRAGVPKDSLLAVLEGIQILALQTPARVNRTSPDSAHRLIETAAAGLRSRFDPWDWATQLRAMLAFDVSAGQHGGSLERAAGMVRARSLLLWATEDHMVTPAVIREWGRMTGAQLLEMPGECGHLATGCNAALVRPAVREFLARP